MPADEDLNTTYHIGFKPLRVGIIRLSSLGDCIVSAAFLANFRNSLRQSGFKPNISWFVDSRFAGILEHSPQIDNLYVLHLKNTPIKHIFSQLKNLSKLEPFDVLIDMQGLVKSAFVGRFIKKRFFVGFSARSAKESLSAFFYTNRVHIAYNEHILVRNALLLHHSLEIMNEHFGTHNPTSKPLVDSVELGQSLQDFSSPHTLLDDMLSLRTRSFDFVASTPALLPYLKILLVLESSNPTKCYSTRLFAEFIDILSNELKRTQHQNLQIVLLAHSQPTKCQEIISLVKQKDNLTLTTLTNLPLDEVKSLVARVNLVIGGDTGITHLAWALGVASITLYGNTPMERFALLSPKNIALSENKNPKYKKDDFSINDILPSQIAYCALQLLESSSLGD